MAQPTEMEEIKYYLDQWSGAINPKTFNALKEQIQIISFTRYPIGYLNLETLTEQRIVYPSLTPVKNEPIDPFCKYEFPDEVDPWQIQMHNPPPHFKEESYVANVPNAARLVACHSCRGSGEITCEICSSTGTIECAHCLGTGVSMCLSCAGTGTEKCEICSGKGTLSIEKTREWLTDDGTLHQKIFSEMEPCGNCHGMGMTTCSKCQGGSINCAHCKGKGKLDCEDCKGSGASKCSVCNGKKQLLSTLITKQKFLKTSDSLVLTVPEISRKYGEYPLRLNLNAKTPDDAYGRTVEGAFPATEYTAFAPEDYMEKYDRINRSHEFFKMNLPSKSSEQIVRQRITFFLADCIVIQYKYNQNLYELMVDTHNNGYFTQNNPFFEVAKTIFRDAEDAFEQKKYGKAYDLAKEAYYQYSDTDNASDATRLLERISTAMNKHYIYGILGGLTAMILLKFISLIDFAVTVAYVILPICATTLVVYALKKITPHLFVKNDYLRIAIGFTLSAILYLMITILLSSGLS